MLDEKHDSSLLANSQGSLQGSILADLENKIHLLQQENEILKLNSESSISAKLVELESQVQEEQRQKLAFETQLEV